MKRDGKTNGFTLIELLMVIVVIGILVGMVSSAVLHSRRAAKKQKTRTDFRTIASAVILYHHQYGSWPAEERLDNGFKVFSNENYYVIDGLVSNSLNMSFLSIGDYQFDGDGNIISPFGDPYIIAINARNGATNHAVAGRVPGRSCTVTNLLME